MPIGEMTTTLQFDFHQKEVFFHQGETVENVNEPKVRRTKLAVEVKNVDKLLDAEWHLCGWHRVTFYGDFRRQAKHLAALLGYKFIEET